MPGLLLWWSQQSLARSNQRVQSAALAQLGSARAAQVLYPAAIPGPFAPPHLRVVSLAPGQVGTAHAALILSPTAGTGPAAPTAAVARMRALSFAPSRVGSAYAAQILVAERLPPRQAKPGTGQLVYAGTAPFVGHGVITATGQLLYTGFAPRFIRAALPGTGLLLFDPFAPTLEGETIVVPPLPDNRLEMVAHMAPKKKKIPRNWRGEPADFTDEEMLLLFGDDED